MNMDTCVYKKRYIKKTKQHVQLKPDHLMRLSAKFKSFKENIWEKLSDYWYYLRAVALLHLHM